MEVKIKDTASLLPNYRLVIASDEIVARIFLSEIGEKITKGKIAKVIENFEKLKDQIAKIMIRYRGPILGECRILETHNKIPNVFRYDLAKKIAGETTLSTLIANYVAVWSGTNAVDDTDTQLQTELVRGTFTDRSSDENTSFLDKFFSTTEVGGLTINEVWVFVDGTGVADSGYLLSRALTSVTLSANETLTVNVSISLTSAT